MPPYFDRQFQVACFLENDTDKDFLMLPCTDAELLRSAKRLGTSFHYDLKVSIVCRKDHLAHPPTMMLKDIITGLAKKKNR